MKDAYYETFRELFKDYYCLRWIMDKLEAEPQVQEQNQQRAAFIRTRDITLPYLEREKCKNFFRSQNGQQEPAYQQLSNKLQKTYTKINSSLPTPIDIGSLLSTLLREKP